MLPKIHLLLPLLGSKFPIAEAAGFRPNSVGALAPRKQIQENSFKSSCSSLASQISEGIPNARVEVAEFVQAGTNLTFLDVDPSCYPRYQITTVDACRVSVDIQTSDSSTTVLEVRLPQNYTRRFATTGNAALGGCIPYWDVDYAASLGFASIGTNNGHDGLSGKPFYKNPEVVEDFAYRSIHTAAVVGKQITNMFYEEGFDTSYYFGCSTGGRSGFKSVQQFPGDFDGVVAGAPAINMNSLISWSGRFLTITGTKESDTFISPELWKIVHEEILRQCDGLDGAEDGIIEDPDMCRPTWDTLICRSGQNGSCCLTSDQVNTLEQIFLPFYGKGGEMIYPRMQPGSEIAASTSLYSGTPFSITEEWFQNVVYENRSWDAATFSLEDAVAAIDANPYNIDTSETDLSAFREAGGKVISYHGLEDSEISSDNSKRYYSHVSQAMDLPPSELDSFYRLFTISGMGHCGFGPGAHSIGHTFFEVSGTDPQDNVLMAIVKWVEEGIAPETIRGTKFSDDDPTKVEFRRKHCRWPRRNVFVGPGNYTDENAWECVV